jgi:phytoene synthase
MTLDAVDAASAEALNAGSSSFAAAARLFNASTRRDARLLYAWCRHCDDVIDGQVLGQGQVSDAGSPTTRLARLESLTRAALRGSTLADPAFVAFQRVALRHRIPPRYPLDLLEGFRMDVEGRRHVTIEDTLRYAYHVAGVVGLMMAVIMGVSPHDAETLDRACDLGLAFQLTNIARDVIEDAERGRIYLPQVWLEEAGVPPDALADPRHRDKVHAVAVRLLDTAELYYASAGLGLHRLPLRAGMAICAAGAVYRGIGSRLRIRGPRAWDQRIVIPRPEKLALLTGGGLAGALAALRSPRAAPRAGLWVRPAADPA